MQLPRLFTIAAVRNGQATLSLVFLVGGIILLIGIGLAFIVLTFLNSSYGYQASNRAVAVASAGVEDAYLKLARSRSYFSVSPTVYTVTVGTYSASVRVEDEGPNQKSIESTATVNGYRRQVLAVVAIATSTGTMDVLSWLQTTL